MTSSAQRIVVSDGSEQHRRPAADQRHAILYISTFQFSGSTALSFVLNAHSSFATIGHTTGWTCSEDEDFRCSCGARLAECPLYSRIAKAVHDAGLPFDFRDFHTEFKLVGNERINRYLTGGLPRLQWSGLERLRDWLVDRVPGCHRALTAHLEINRQLIRTVLDYRGARIYVDNSHDPYRLRHLSGLKDMRLINLHLLRDPHGVVWSCIKNFGWSAHKAIGGWLRRQADIVRIAREFPGGMLMHYEDLCEATEETLASVCQHCDVETEPFDGNLQSREHHILGNVMRLRSGTLKLDNQWRTRLTAEDRATVETALGRARSGTNDPSLQAITGRYLEN